MNEPAARTGAADPANALPWRRPRPENRTLEAFDRAKGPTSGGLARNLGALQARLRQRPHVRDRRASFPVRTVMVIAALAVVVIAVALVEFDPNALNWTRSVRVSHRAFFRMVTSFGQSEWFLVPTGLLGIWLLFGDWSRTTRRIAGAWAEVGALTGFAFVSIACAGLTSTLLKSLVGRARPRTSGEVFGFDPVAFDYANLSFPSGHATTVAAAWMTFALIMRHRPAWVWTAAALAGLVAASRVILGVHYPSDVIAGTLVGVIFTIVFAHALARRGVAFQYRPDGALVPKTVALRGVLHHGGLRALGAGFWSGWFGSRRPRQRPENTGFKAAIRRMPHLCRRIALLSFPDRTQIGTFGMKRIIGFSTAAAVLFVTMVIIEAVKADEPLSATEFVLELFEMALLALAVVATAYVSLETREMRREREDLVNDLARARADGDRWRTTARVHVEGLSRAIREQFDAWRLSESEADIAILMLKGLSHKEISRLRDSGEATVRQQAAAIYRKSGLASRAELAAFFLEDLLAPEAERHTSMARSLKLVEPEI